MKDINSHINELINRCKKNDRFAQMSIYNAYSKAMYNTAFRIVNDAFEAEDVMQESFLKAFIKIDSFKGEASFGAWLKRIVINNSLNQLKKSKKYQKIKLEVVEQEEEEELVINYESISKEIVLDSIGKLKENYRIVLTLHLIEGYDYNEIAQILNYTNQNVRTTFSRAKSKLKQILLENPKIREAYER